LQKRKQKSATAGYHKVYR